MLSSQGNASKTAGSVPDTPHTAAAKEFKETIVSTVNKDVLATWTEDENRNMAKANPASNPGATRTPNVPPQSEVIANDVEFDDDIIGSDINEPSEKIRAVETVPSPHAESSVYRPGEVTGDLSAEAKFLNPPIYSNTVQLPPMNVPAPSVMPPIVPTAPVSATKKDVAGGQMASGSRTDDVHHRIHDVASARYDGSDSDSNLSSDDNDVGKEERREREEGEERNGNDDDVEGGEETDNGDQPAANVKVTERTEESMTPDEILEEKTELMNNIKSMIECNIVPPVRPTFGMNLTTLRRISRIMETKFEETVSIGVIGTAFVAFMKILETGNERFDPLGKVFGMGLKLQGMSRMVEDQIHDYEVPFKRIYQRYLHRFMRAGGGAGIGNTLSPFLQMGMITVGIVKHVHEKNMVEETKKQVRAARRDPRLCQNARSVLSGGATGSGGMPASNNPPQPSGSTLRQDSRMNENTLQTDAVREEDAVSTVSGESAVPPVPTVGRSVIRPVASSTTSTVRPVEGKKGTANAEFNRMAQLPGMAMTNMINPMNNGFDATNAPDDAETDDDDFAEDDE
jgi:hypothetical protein